MTRAAPMLLLLSACSVAPPPAPAPVAVAARVPQRTDLPCFPCHSQVKFESGPRFPHAIAAHKAAGHCHVCHVGTGHHGREIDREACLSCHEAGSEPLARLATRDRPSR